MSAPRRLLPSLTALRALEALERLGSATAVAEELALTQSAVSRQLQGLEAQLGVELIVRERQRLHLSVAARAYAVEVRQALNQIAQASLRLSTSSSAGALNLAILPTFGMRWLVPRLPSFARANPEVTINMATRLNQFNFATEPFDCALHYGNADWAGTQSLLLENEIIAPVCAPEILSRAKIKRAADVARLPLLHITTRAQAWEDWFAAQGHSDLAPSGTYHDQFTTIIQAALHGLGVALVPLYLIERELAEGQLAIAYGAPVQSTGAYHLVWPIEKAREPALVQFRDWLSTQVHSEDMLPR